MAAGRSQGTGIDPPGVLGKPTTTGPARLASCVHKIFAPVESRQKAVLTKLPVQIPLADSKNLGGIAAVAFTCLNCHSDVLQFDIL